jgi:hypothetical protein
MPNWKFSMDIRLGEMLTAIGLLAGGLLAYGNFSAEMAIIKQGQAAQADTNRAIRAEIREVKDDVKEQSKTLRDIEGKINRARL